MRKVRVKIPRKKSPAQLRAAERALEKEKLAQKTAQNQVVPKKEARLSPMGIPRKARNAPKRRVENPIQSKPTVRRKQKGAINSKTAYTVMINTRVWEAFKAVANQQGVPARRLLNAVVERSVSSDMIVEVAKSLL